MRRVGIVLLVVGLAGFLFASGHREKASWETARWMILGAAVMGLVFTVLPGKES